MNMTQLILTIKNVNITPGIAARIVVYALMSVWLLTFAQRAKVIGDSYSADFDFTNIAQVKYLLGLSYSAEEARAFMDSADRLNETRKRFERRGVLRRPTFRQ